MPLQPPPFRPKGIHGWPALHFPGLICHEEYGSLFCIVPDVKSVFEPLNGTVRLGCVRQAPVFILERHVAPFPGALVRTCFLSCVCICVCICVCVCYVYTYAYECVVGLRVFSEAQLSDGETASTGTAPQSEPGSNQYMGDFSRISRAVPPLVHLPET
jgi:hypothetical protein